MARSSIRSIYSRLISPGNYARISHSRDSGEFFSLLRSSDRSNNSVGSSSLGFSPLFKFRPKILAVHLSIRSFTKFHKFHRPVSPIRPLCSFESSSIIPYFFHPVCLLHATKRASIMHGIICHGFRVRVFLSFFFCSSGSSVIIFHGAGSEVPVG